MNPNSNTIDATKNNLSQGGNHTAGTQAKDAASTATDHIKSNLSQAGTHLKDAATHAGEAIKSLSSAASDEARLGGANVKADLADSARSGLTALEHAGAASKEQMDALMEKGRDLVESAADLVRERPLASFGVAFAAGWIIAKLARSDK